MTKQARRSDALFYDEVSRRTLCDMVARLEMERDNLKDKLSASSKRLNDKEVESSNNQIVIGLLIDQLREASK